MNLSAHVTLDEFIFTQHRNINNDLPADLLATARETCQVVERIRECMSVVMGRNVPILISSGYRCMELNRAIGSKDNSDHPRAMAVDFCAPGYGTPYQVAKLLAQHVDHLGIGQLIHEFGRWVHVSTRRPDKPINRIITISDRGVELGVVPV